MVEPERDREPYQEPGSDPEPLWRRFSIPAIVVGGIVLLILIWLVITIIAGLNENSQAPETTRSQPETSNQQSEQGSDTAPGPRSEAVLSDILQHPTNYYRKAVTVSGGVQAVLNTQAVALHEEGYEGQLLVVSKNPISNVDTQDTVEATGTVQKFSMDEIEQELGANLDDTVFEPFVGKPVVVASSVTVRENNR